MAGVRKLLRTLFLLTRRPPSAPTNPDADRFPPPRGAQGSRPGDDPGAGTEPGRSARVSIAAEDLPLDRSLVLTALAETWRATRPESPSALLAVFRHRCTAPPTRPLRTMVQSALAGTWQAIRLKAPSAVEHIRMITGPVRAEVWSVRNGIYGSGGSLS